LLIVIFLLIIVTIHRAIVIVITVLIYTCFLLCIKLLFSYSATQPQVWNKTLCQCQLVRVEYFAKRYHSKLSIPKFNAMHCRYTTDFTTHRMLIVCI